MVEQFDFLFSNLSMQDLINEFGNPKCSVGFKSADCYGIFHNYNQMVVVYTSKPMQMYLINFDECVGVFKQKYNIQKKGYDTKKIQDSSCIDIDIIIDALDTIYMLEEGAGVTTYAGQLRAGPSCKW